MCNYKCTNIVGHQEKNAKLRKGKEMYCTKTAGRDKMELATITGTENVRDQLIAEIMTLTEEQLDYVLQHLEEVL